jgi:hypothetical protein
MHTEKLELEKAKLELEKTKVSSEISSNDPITDTKSTCGILLMKMISIFSAVWIISIHYL